MHEGATGGVGGIWETAFFEFLFLSLVIGLNGFVL
jgi:hypothetical protein